MLRNLLVACNDSALHLHLNLLATLRAFPLGWVTLAITWAGALTMPNLVHSLRSFACCLEHLSYVVVADRDTAPSAMLCAASNAAEVLAMHLSGQTARLSSWASLPTLMPRPPLWHELPTRPCALGVRNGLRSGTSWASLAGPACPRRLWGTMTVVMSLGLRAEQERGE